MLAVRWVFINTEGLEVLFAVKRCLVRGKQTSNIHPAHEARRLCLNSLLQKSQGTDTQVHRVQTKNISGPMHVVMFS